MTLILTFLVAGLLVVPLYKVIIKSDIKTKLKEKLTFRNIIPILLIIAFMVYSANESKKPTAAEVRGYNNEQEKVLKKVQRRLLGID